MLVTPEIECLEGKDRNINIYVGQTSEFPAAQVLSVNEVTFHSSYSR
jgi:hypothetical protein